MGEAVFETTTPGLQGRCTILARTLWTSQACWRAMAGKEPWDQWHSQHSWHCVFCNLQKANGRRKNESHSLRQHHHSGYLSRNVNYYKQIRYIEYPKCPRNLSAVLSP